MLETISSKGWRHCTDSDWYAAINFVNNLSTSDASDAGAWRMPTADEVTLILLKAGKNALTNFGLTAKRVWLHTENWENLVVPVANCYNLQLGKPEIIKRNVSTVCTLAISQL